MNINKKILLISANICDVPYPVYPIGVSYLSTYLKNKLRDYEIKLFDMITDKPENLEKFIKEFDPGLIGLSMRNIDNVNSVASESYVQGYKNIMESVRVFSKSPIVVGGSGFSIFPELLFDWLGADFGIYGEGEESLLKLIKHLEFNTNYEDVDGLVYKKDGITKINPRRNALKELELEFEDNYLDFYWLHSGMLNIQTKRGCPYQCIYCSYPIIDGRDVRTLSADKIVTTIKRLYETKGIDYIFFTDSVFNIGNAFNIELTEKIIKSGVKIRWGAYFSLHNLEEDMLRLFKESGLTHIEFGTEALSDTQLKNYGKMFTVNDIIEKSSLCEKIGVDFAHFLILGGYGETDDTIDESMENSKKIGRSVFFPFIGMRIYPGTKLQQLAIEEGKISKNDDLLLPKYYISDKFNAETLKQKAEATGKSWIFPDRDLSEGMYKMRMKNKKGPLWEYLLK